MSLKPIAPAFFPHCQSSSDAPLLLCNSITMSLPWLNTFKEFLHKSSHLLLLLITNPLLTASSSSLFSSGKIHLSRMQQFINHLLDLSPICPHLSNIKRTVYMLFTRPYNSSTNTWRQNTSTERHYNVLSFNRRVTSHYCAICFFAQLEPFLSVILPSKTPLPVL